MVTRGDLRSLGEIWGHSGHEPTEKSDSTTQMQLHHCNYPVTLSLSLPLPHPLSLPPPPPAR